MKYWLAGAAIALIAGAASAQLAPVGGSVGGTVGGAVNGAGGTVTGSGGATGTLPTPANPPLDRTIDNLPRSTDRVETQTNGRVDERVNKPLPGTAADGSATATTAKRRGKASGSASTSKNGADAEGSVSVDKTPG